MASPVGFPQGLTTFPKRSVLSTYPISTSPRQIAITEDFLPYRAGDYTVTTAVAGAITTFPMLGGGIKLATSASATDTILMSRNGAGYQFLPGMQLWFDAKVCIPRSVLNTNDSACYVGLFDTSNPTTAPNGVYFLRPAFSFWYLILRLNGTNTSYGPLIDPSLPSGIFNDANSVNGTLNCTIAGGVISAVSVATPGSGYQCAPLILATAAAGNTGTSNVSCTIGSSAFTPGNPPAPIQSTALSYGSLYAPYVLSSNGGYTNGSGTTLLEVEPVLDVQFWWDGKTTLYAGVNGRALISIGSQGVIPTTVGVTTNAPLSLASQAFSITNQLSPSIAPVQPALGSAFNAMPRVPLSFGAGITNTTANVRTMFVMEHNIACEYL